MSNHSIHASCSGKGAGGQSGHGGWGVGGGSLFVPCIFMRLMDVL